MKMPHGYVLDIVQQAISDRLHGLSQDLMAYERRSWGERLRGFFYSSERPRGLYIYGPVGRGKTMLMDAFYEELHIAKKQRWHFHAFMNQAVHQRLKALSGVTQNQPIEILAREISQQAHVLCFDEFHVTDIADAMILARLFTILFQNGVVVVATSNQRPDDLYKDGLHRDRFLPFVRVLKDYCDDVELDGTMDYRRAMLHKHRRYFSPINDEARQEMDQIFLEMSAGHVPTPTSLTINARELVIPQSANGVARISFDTLCQANLGANDYLSLADHFHTILLENVPQMNVDMYNQARRFITLIDILYDRDVNLVMSAAARPDELFIEGENRELFDRTASRLIEMTGS